MSKKIKSKDLRSCLRLSLNKYGLKSETVLAIKFVKEGVHTMHDIGVFIEELGVDTIPTDIELILFIERLHQC